MVHQAKALLPTEPGGLSSILETAVVESPELTSASHLHTHAVSLHTHSFKKKKINEFKQKWVAKQDAPEAKLPCRLCRWPWATLSPRLALFIRGMRMMGTLISWGFFLKGNTILTIARVCAFP